MALPQFRVALSSSVNLSRKLLQTCPEACRLEDSQPRQADNEDDRTSMVTVFTWYASCTPLCLHLPPNLNLPMYTQPPVGAPALSTAFSISVLLCSSVPSCSSDRPMTGGSQHPQDMPHGATGVAIAPFHPYISHLSVTAHSLPPPPPSFKHTLVHLE